MKFEFLFVGKSKKQTVMIRQEIRPFKKRDLKRKSKLIVLNA